MADGNGSDVTAVDKRQLFEGYDIAKADVVKAAEALNDAVKKIVESCGQGPFAWKGQELTIAKRGEGFAVRVKARKAEEIV